MCLNEMQPNQLCCNEVEDPFVFGMHIQLASCLLSRLECQLRLTIYEIGCLSIVCNYRIRIQDKFITYEPDHYKLG